MADVVQYRLERMVDELDDLERRGLFTRREIAEIVKQRRKFEYRLKRPSPLKHDFLAYIEYEKQLDALRILRNKAISHKLKKEGSKKLKKSISDFAGVSRIIETYRLATNRFKGDIALWFQYLEFCRERSNGRMKKVLAQVIRFHPKVPGMWIYAAAWEFDQNLNIAAARALMQSGLRACPTSEALWIEYLRMELTYLNKLKARRVALGEDEGTLIRHHNGTDDKEWKDENKELFMPLNEIKESDGLSDSQNEETEKKVDLFREQGLSILRTVYSGAVDALPSSFTLRTQFLEILEATDLAHSEDMQKEILAEMKRDFAKRPEYWDWLAKFEATDSQKRRDMNKDMLNHHSQKAIKVYDEALEVLPTATMFSLYIKYLMDVITPNIGEVQGYKLFSPSVGDINAISQILKIYEKAEIMGCLTEDLACQYTSFYLQLGQFNEARKLAEKLCGETFSNSVQLWVLRLSIEMRCLTEKSPSPTKSDLSSIFDLLKNILVKVAITEADSLWTMALKYLANQRRYFDKLVETSLVVLARDGGSDGGFSLSSAIVNFVLQRDGIPRAREMYKRYLALPHPGLAIYRKCIELEFNLASAGDKDGLAQARKLYESALATYDQDLSLWRDYYAMEIKMGTSETSAAVCWRARKTLKDNDLNLSPTIF